MWKHGNVGATLIVGGSAHHTRPRAVATPPDAAQDLAASPSACDGDVPSSPLAEHDAPIVLHGTPPPTWRMRARGGASSDEIRESLAVVSAQLERYRRFIQLSNEGIWCFEFEPMIPLDLDVDAKVERAMATGVLVECNDSLARMYGYERAEELLGTPLREFMGFQPENEAYLRTFFNCGLRLENGETQERDRNGELRHFLNNLLGVVYDRQLAQVWGTQRDVTAIKQLEAKLQHAQKLEAIGQLAGGIAHDFNNMLMVISGNLGLVLEHAELVEDHALALQDAHQAAERAAHLTRELLTFSRRSLVAPERLSIHRVVENANNLLRHFATGPASVRVQIPDTLPPVIADAVQLEQMLLNLFLNAHDAMDGGGEIVLDVSLETPVHGAGGAAPDACADQWIALRIADTGIGIPEELQDRIFDPFYTSKDVTDTAGLGLSVVYGIVKRWGGTIEVQSAPGRGSTFTVRLPAVIEPLLVADDDADRFARPEEITILVVEDHRHVLEVIDRFLAASGYTTITARNAAEGIDVVRSRNGPIDLVICDIVMPGTGGVELCEQIRKIRPTTPVVFMSGYADVPAGDGDLGPNARLLPKPFTRQQLERAILDTLGARDAD